MMVEPNRLQEARCFPIYALKIKSLKLFFKC